METPPKKPRQRKSHARYTALIKCRVTKDQLKNLKDTAKKHGMGLSKFLRLRMDNLPVHDAAHEKAFVSAIHSLTNQMNHIGNNINQATVAIHLIKNGHKIPDGDFSEYNRLIAAYLAQGEALRAAITKLLGHGRTGI